MAAIREPKETNGVGKPAPNANTWAPSGKSSVPAAVPAYADFGATEAGNGKAIALAYGTVKVTAVILEQAQPMSSPPVTWYGGVPYGVGQYVLNGGNTYVCVTSGTSAGTGGPSGTGTDITDWLAHWKYVQSGAVSLWICLVLFGLCEGPIAGVLQIWWDQENYANPLQKGLLPTTGADNSELNNSPAGTSFWPTPWRYQNIALLASSAVILGTSKSIAGTVLGEVNGLQFGGGTADVNAADLVNDMLTHGRRGVGWPGSKLADLTPFRTYTDAAGLRLSMLIDAQRKAIDVLADVLLITNSDAVWSGGQLKIVPRGDTAIAAPVYSATPYTPANAAVYALGPDDFLEPIQIQRRSEADSYNDCPVTYVSRPDGYSEQTVSDPDVADIQRRQLAGAPNSGKNSAGATSLGAVVAPESATMLSRLWAQRNVNCRNTYTFKLGWRYLLLEPTDIVTISDSVMGISNLPVRILAIEESIGANGGGELTITAEDWPAGVATAARWTPQAGDGYAPNQASAAASIAPVSPGDVQAAQTTATTASSAAATAQSAASTAQSTASAAQSTASAAQTTANTAQADATAAKNTAPITASRLTSPPNDNIFPNGMNLVGVVPSGADATTPEWAGLVATATGWRGAYVRQLACTPTSSPMLGDLTSKNEVGASQGHLGLASPASPGDQFYLEGMMRSVSGGNGTNTMGAFIYYLDKNGTILHPSSYYLSVNTALFTNTAAWTKTWFTSAPCPAGTVQIKAFFYADAAAGVVTVQVDSIYLRRAVAAGALAVNSLQTTNYTQDGSGFSTAGARLSNDPAAPALKVASGQFQIGKWVFDDLASGGSNGFFSRLLNGLDNSNADGQGQRAFYAGSTSHGGVPDINALTAVSQQWDIVYLPVTSGGTGSAPKTIIDMIFFITPTALTQNLDGLRYISVWWCNNSNQGLIWSYVPIVDRAHGTGGGGVAVSYQVTIPGAYSSGHNGSAGSFLYFKARLFGVYGASAEKYYQAPATMFWGQWEYGVPPFGTPTPPAGGGGGGGGACPAPWVKVQLASGLWVPAGSLVDGMKVRGFDEHDPSRCQVGTVSMPTTVLRPRMDIVCADGTVTSFSHDHRLVVEGKGFSRVNQLKPGDVISRVNAAPLVVKMTKDIGNAPVVQFEVDGSHTYFADGFAHNVAKLPY